MESGAVPTQNSNQLNQHYKRLKKSSLETWLRIQKQNIEALRRRSEAERIRKEEEERKIKEQIAKRKEDDEKNLRLGASQSYFYVKGSSDKVKLKW